MSTLDKRERTGAGLAAGSVLLVGGSVAASSLLDGYPIFGGQAVRYLAAGILLAAWARLQRKPLPRPAGREWAWLAALAAIGLAGCSVLMIQATRVADPASVGVIIGAAPLVIIIAAAITAGHHPTRRVLLAAAVVTAGSVAAQLGGATGPTWSPAGLLWSAGALGGVVGSSCWPRRCCPGSAPSPSPSMPAAWPAPAPERRPGCSAPSPSSPACSSASAVLGRFPPAP